MEEKGIAVYSRKSRFTGKGESIENQVELCRKYSLSHFGKEPEFVYEDEGFSGGNLERPKFKEMMGEARRGRLSAILVYRLDRISRNIGDFARLIEELNELDVSFTSIKEQFDTSSPMGRAMMYIASVFSQLERETIAERIRDNMQELSKTGRWLGGTTPTGFASESVSKVTVDGKLKKACRLKVIPEEAELVRELFEQFLMLGSLTKLEAYCMKRGLKSKNGRDFTRFTLRGILENPVYLTADEEACGYLKERGIEVYGEKEDFDGKHGMLAYNRTLQQKGKGARRKEERDWILAVGDHPGLIAGESWVRVQRLLNENSAKGYRRPRSQEALLSGILRCAFCQSYMRPKTTGKFLPDGKQKFSYLCSMKERSRKSRCEMKNVPGNLLDEKVIEALGAVELDKKELVRLLKKETRSSQKKERGRAEKQLLREVPSFTDVLKELPPLRQREAVRLLVKKAEWDGETAHLYF